MTMLFTAEWKVDPLSAAELALMTPVWWAWCLEGARSQLLRESGSNLDWDLTHIIRRSPIIETWDSVRFREGSV
ncbi:MAG: hypothetical protein ABR507_03300 [Actinomycetota bacterium]|nr:hypothetical protein [Actinomycetota bacterium]